MSCHVDRSRLAARALLAGTRYLDASRVEVAIEATRFPAPIPAAELDPEARLLRAADPIGQTADPDDFDKADALFLELTASGADVGAGYASAEELVAGFGGFYSAHVAPVLESVRPWLEATPGVRGWLAKLSANRISRPAASAHRPERYRWAPPGNEGAREFRIAGSSLQFERARIKQRETLGSPRRA